MANTSIKYIIYNHNGSGKRGHHFGPENNLIAPASGSASPGNVINVMAFPTLRDLLPPDPVMGNVANFAFMSINGAADGNHIITNPGVYNINVGNSDVNILLVYIQAQWQLQEASVVWIDAFNADTGDFSDSDFLQSTLPADNGQPHPFIDDLAYDGNNIGVFSMNGVNSNWPYANVLATIDGTPFLMLENFDAANLITNPEITVQPGEIWFAFFQTPHPVNPGDPCANLRKQVENFNINEFPAFPLSVRQKALKYYEKLKVMLLECERVHGFPK